MLFRILGPVEIQHDAGLIDLGPRRGERCLLGLLLLAADGGILANDRLQTLLWDDDPPAGAQRTVHTYVARLRARLKPHGIRIATRGNGYRIEIDPAQVDAHRFTAAVARARDTDDPGVRAAVLAEALTLWRGPLLADAAGDYLRARVGAALEERRFTAIELLAQADLDCGRHEKVLTDLTRLVEEHPTREHLTELLMLAYYRAGRQGDALAAYRRVWKTLDTELGVAPGPGLRDLQARILANDPGLAMATVPRFLPRAVPDFAGREADLRRLDEIAGESAAVAGSALITGAPGAGKTALAVHWGHAAAHRYPDGQLYVDLRGFATGRPLRPVDALAQVLRALGQPSDRIPVDPAEAAGLYRSLLAERRVLVLLDNAATIDQVRPLLPGGAGSLALITSRDRLSGLVARDGARRLDLGVLSARDAEDLLARVLGRDRAGGEPDAVADLAAACGYLPLALRIAAANLADQPGKPIADYVSQLRGGDRLAALAIDGDQDSTVRAAFDQSYARLTAPAARLFRLLGMVTGPDIPLPAAAALADLPLDTTETLLRRLTAAHLVQERADGRYSLHDLLRLYAYSLRDPETPGARQRLIGWYLVRADAAARRMMPNLPLLPLPAPVPAPVPPGDVPADWLDEEAANLVACVRDAYDHDLPEHCCALADRLRPYFHLARDMIDWLPTAEYAQSAAPAVADPFLAAAEAAAAELSIAFYFRGLGRYDEAKAYGRRAVDLAEPIGWADGHAAALVNLGVVHLWTGEYEQSAGYARRALDAHRLTGNGAGQAQALGTLAFVCLSVGDLGEAERCFREAVGLHREAGARNSEGLALANLGDTLRYAGRLTEAATVLRESLTVLRAAGGRLAEAVALINLAYVECESGDLDTALHSATAALDLVRETGDPNAEANVLNRVAIVHSARGDHRQAVDLLQTALDLCIMTGGRDPELDARVALTHALLGLDDPAAALPHARTALDLARELGIRVTHGYAAAALAAVKLRLGEVAEGRRLAAEALAYHEEIGQPLGIRAAQALLEIV
ncbi:AfsR/SARP family transcriptional regulator [Hamadaea tsunoensis]|uniref:AfsR/SARP family transcriptional regulator n=1 Tax=Hamadaea tsunoensis TaxID=53368 RepID=UPI00040B19D3|nr:BTAD domain-containing putative transcriptional regulator [Hamadaea tsunoensis]